MGLNSAFKGLRQYLFCEIEIVLRNNAFYIVIHNSTRSSPSS